MKYGFLDESGNVGRGPGSSSHLIVAVVVVGNPERLRKAVVKTRKAFSRQVKEAAELKAMQNDPRITERLLTHAVEVGFEAIGVVADKSKFPSLLHPEDLYRSVCARAVREVLTRFGALSLTIDQRYTARKLQRQMDQMLTACIQDMRGIALAFNYQDSRREKALQVADAVAWTLFQKHERGDESLWRIIQERVTEVRA